MAGKTAIVAVALGVCAAACGGTPSSVAGDAGPTGDGGNPPEDGAPVDAGPVDAGGIDGSPGDAGPLRTTLGDPPYVLGQPGGTDIRDSVTGGEPPYTCEIYAGPAPGTVPSGIDGSAESSGCQFTGGVDVGAGDSPGAYGFTVTVTDNAGATVEVPVAYEGPPCSAGDGAVTPAPWPVAVNAPGTAATFEVEVGGLDGVVGPAGCGPCFDLSVLTRRPLSATTGLRCSDEGDLCSDCDDCISVNGSCPGANIGVVNRDVVLRAHAPLRPEGAAWATVSIDAAYSGASADPCGTERFRCHIEMLELP